MSGKKKNSITLRNHNDENLADYLFADSPESHTALALLKHKLNVEIYPSENITKINIKGVDAKEIGQAKTIFYKLAASFSRGEPINEAVINKEAKQAGISQEFIDNRKEVIKSGRSKREKRTHNKEIRDNPEKNINIIEVETRNDNQTEFLDDIANNDVTFGVGPAGTGKTFLAAYEAVKAFKEGKVDKIFLARPAVGNGKDLGALPGDEKAKLAPYLRPLYDEIENLIGKDMSEKLQEKGFIEIAPVEFMRGRTFKKAFIILDEAQNTSREQIKMALTRVGEGSKMVVTGDPGQVDLPDSTPSGLAHVLSKLEGVEGVGIRSFTTADIVRSKVVSRIVMALEGSNENKPQLEQKKNNPSMRR